jgi:hypothetical protein
VKLVDWPGATGLVGAEARLKLVPLLSLGDPSESDPLPKFQIVKVRVRVAPSLAEPTFPVKVAPELLQISMDPYRMLISGFWL